MKQIKSSDAKARFSELLNQVEQGETVVITRHGKAIARIVPEGGSHQARTLQTMERIDSFRKTMPRLTLAELLSARHEGHKY